MTTIVNTCLFRHILCIHRRSVCFLPVLMVVMWSLFSSCNSENEIDQQLLSIENGLTDSVIDISKLINRLDSIPQSALDDNRRENIFNLLDLRLSMANGDYPQNDSMLNQVIDYFEHNSDQRRLAEALITRSYYRRYHSENFKDALADAMAARDLSYKIEDTLLMARSEKLLMLNFEPVYQKDSVLDHAMKSSIYYAASNRYGNVREVKMYCAIYKNSIGLTDEALTLMDSVLCQTPLDDSIAVGEIYNRKIGMYVAKGEFLAADSSFRKAMCYFGDKSLANIDWRYVLRMFYESRDLDSVERYLPVMREHCQTADGNDFYYRYSQFLAENRGDYKTAYENLRYVDSIMNERNQIAVNQAPSIVSSDYFNRKATEEKQRVKSRNHIIITIILLSFLVVLSLLFVLKIQRKRHRDMEIKAIFEISSLKDQFSERSIDRSVAENLFKAGFDSLDKLIAQYFSLNYHGNISSEQFFREISVQMEKFRSKETLEKLVEKVDQLHNGILTEISSSPRKLKREDVYFLSLRIAGFSHKSICFFLGITPTNYYTKWQRIRQRIASAGESTVQALQKILSL